MRPENGTTVPENFHLWVAIFRRMPTIHFWGCHLWQNTQVTGQKFLKGSLEKNSECPDNGAEVPEGSLKKNPETGQITGQKSLKGSLEKIPAECPDNGTAVPEMFLDKNPENAQIMGQKSLKVP